MYYQYTIREEDNYNIEIKYVVKLNKHVQSKIYRCAEFADTRNT